MDPSTFQKWCMIEQLNIYNSIIWYLVKNQPASRAGERKNQRLGVEPSLFPPISASRWSWSSFSRVSKGPCGENLTRLDFISTPASYFQKEGIFVRNIYMAAIEGVF